jgi:hypothetical protein
MRRQADAKSRQPDLAGRSLSKNVCRFDFLVNETRRVELLEGACDGDGQAQELYQFKWSAEAAVERLAARIFEQ